MCSLPRLYLNWHKIWREVEINISEMLCDLFNLAAQVPKRCLCRSAFHARKMKECKWHV